MSAVTKVKIRRSGLLLAGDPEISDRHDMRTNLGREFVGDRVDLVLHICRITETTLRILCKIVSTEPGFQVPRFHRR